MKSRSRGMALVVVLLLLAGVLLLAVAGLGSAIAALALADFDERAASAFEAAEAGITRTLEDGAPLSPPVVPWPQSVAGLTVATSVLEDHPDLAPAWPTGISLEAIDGGLVLRHGRIVADAAAGRGAQVRIEQAYAVLAPARESAQ